MQVCQTKKEIFVNSNPRNQVQCARCQLSATPCNHMQSNTFQCNDMQCGTLYDIAVLHKKTIVSLRFTLWAKAMQWWNAVQVDISAIGRNNCTAVHLHCTVDCTRVEVIDAELEQGNQATCRPLLSAAFFGRITPSLNGLILFLKFVF